MDSTKRKRKFVPLKVKLEALKRLDKGETLKKLAVEYGVGEVTVGDWRRNRSKLEAFSGNKCSDVSLDRKSLKKSDYEKTGEALFMWFTQQRQKGCPLSGPILKEKALLFQKEFEEGDQNFTASVGWFDKWKKRYGIRQLEMCGEKLSADSEAVVKFCKKLQEIVKNEKLTNDQLYNCDETGLNFKMLPSKTLASREEKSAPGHKKSKERLTVLATSNASGNHKMKLVVVGKSTKPRAFKHICVSSLPVTYKSQKSAWMTQKIFKDWFYSDFVPEVKKFLKERNLPCKAILTLDNAGSHPNEDELNCDGIRAMFLPPNVTSLIQPMDQGILQCLKKKYRRRLLQSLLESIEGEETIVDVLKKITVKDVVYWVAGAWDEITSETLQKSWNKILKNEGAENNTNQDISEDDMPLFNFIKKIPGCENTDSISVVEEWQNNDDQLEFTDAAIVDMINLVEQDDSEEEDVTNDSTPRMSHSEGLAALEAAMRYVEQQPEATPVDNVMLRRWRDIAARKRNNVFKQKTIDNYFKM